MPSGSIASGESVAERAFFDTNILIYAADPRDPEKREKARALIGRHRLEDTGCVSTQVLQEYFHAITRKSMATAAVAREQVEDFAAMGLIEIRLPLILAAIDLHLRRGLSLWDALIVKAALAAGCAVVYTEDLQDGDTIEGVRIENPFAHRKPKRR
jgi:predicted nucleic acid-binding protein